MRRRRSQLDAEPERSARLGMAAPMPDRLALHPDTCLAGAFARDGAHVSQQDRIAAARAQRPLRARERTPSRANARIGPDARTDQRGRFGRRNALWQQGDRSPCLLGAL